MVLGQKHGTNYLPYTLETHLVEELKKDIYTSLEALNAVRVNRNGVV